MLTELIEIFAKITIILATGYWFARRKVITEEMKKNLSTMLMGIVLYFNILSSSQQDLNPLYLKGFFLVFFLSCVYYVISLWALKGLAGRFSLPEKGKNVFVTMAVFANVGFIGFSMAGELIGEEGTLYTVAVNVAFQLFFFSYGVYLLSKESGKGIKFNLKSLLHNEALLVSMTAVLLYLLPFRFPEFLKSTLSTVGSIMMPLSMLVIGAEIAGMKLGEILKDPYSYLISFLRLIFFPLLMLAVVKLLRVPQNAALTLVLLSALPSGSMNVILAQQYDCDPEFATRSVAQSMLLMLVMLPVMITLAKVVL